MLPLPTIKAQAPRVLSDEEQRALFLAARGDTDMRLLLRLMRFSCLRVAEVTGHRRLTYDPFINAWAAYEVPGIRIGDIDLVRSRMVVRGKGGTDGIAFLDRRTAQLIMAFIPTLVRRQPEDPLFQLSDGRPRGTRWAFRAFAALRVQAGIGRHVTLHMLRHTFLTRFLEHGGDLRAAQRLARHQRLETTLIYADFVRDEALRAQFDTHSPEVEPKGTAH